MEQRASFMNLKTKISKLHYDKNAKGLFVDLLEFLSIFYGFVSKIRNIMYDKNILKSEKINAKVISVGNVTTGGVGKTPVVAKLAQYYINQDKKVAVISRGYGGKLSNKNINLISVCEIKEPMRVCAKVRYRHSAQSATVTQIDSDTIKVVFDTPQRAITKGQSVVLYDGDTVVGGGIIQ